MTTTYIIIGIWLLGAVVCYVGNRWFFYRRHESRYRLCDRVFNAFVSLFSWVTIVFITGVLLITRGNKNNVLDKEVKW